MANIVAICSGCQARYQVASTNAGKKFRCQKCQTIVTVPEMSHNEEDIDDFLSDIIDSSAAQSSSSSGIRRAPAAAARGRAPKAAAAPPPRAQRAAAPAAPPARGRQAAPPPARQAPPPRGRQAPPPAAPPPARGPAARGGRGAPPPAPGHQDPYGRGRQPAPGGNNTPVIIGAIAGVVLLLGIVGFIVMGSGGDGGGTTQVGGGTGDIGDTSNPDNTGSSQETPADREAQAQADYDQLYGMGTSGATLSDKVRGLIKAADFAEDTWGENDERAMRAWHDIITLDPDNTDARRKLGYRKYRYPEDAIEDDDYLARADLSTDLLDELETLANEGRWLSEDEYQAAIDRQNELFESVRAEMRRREEDPSYELVRRVEGNIALHPYWKDVDMEARFYHDELPCYIFFIEKNGSRSIDELGQEKKRIGMKLFEFFKENWADPSNVDKVDDQPMVCFVLSNRASYEAYCQYQGTNLPPGARAHFSPMDIPLRPVMFYEGPISAQEMQNNPEGAIADNVRVFCHECTHQLHNRYTHTDNARFHCMLHLFLEGLAEFHGGVNILDGGRRFEMPGDYETRLEEFYNAWMAKEEWPRKYNIPANRIVMEQPILRLPHILQIDHSGTLQRVSLGFSRAALQMDGAMSLFASLFYAEAWSFFKFLWTYRNGYYRDELQEYASREFHGETGISIFLEVFGLETNEDIFELEDQWVEWVMDYMEEILGKRPNAYDTSYRERANERDKGLDSNEMMPRFLEPERNNRQVRTPADPLGVFIR